MHVLTMKSVFIFLCATLWGRKKYLFQKYAVYIVSENRQPIRLALCISYAFVSDLETAVLLKMILITYFKSTTQNL